MIRIERSAPVVLTALFVLLVACGPAGGPGAKTEKNESGATAMATATSVGENGPTAGASAIAGEASQLAEKNDLYEFKHSWPTRAGAIPALRQRMEAERADLLQALKNDAGEARDAALADGYPYRTYAFEKEWSVVADLPRFLSLSAQIYSYTGGAHGMSVFDALVWEREAGEGIEPVAMFRSPAALDRAVRVAFCDELDRQRAKRRGGPVKRSIDSKSGNSFDDCIVPTANSSVIVGSASKKAFDRIGFLIPPYNAGSYAEGSYEVTLPVTSAILDAVRPEYREAFAPGR